MTDEKAIKRIRLLQQDECDCVECKKNKEAYETILDLLEKKDRIIDRMARYSYLNWATDTYDILKIKMDINSEITIKNIREYFEEFERKEEE